ncbi:MAG: gliding motility-associated C-terminal domain-containing protein, partial [Bacteroidia bacterium]
INVSCFGLNNGSATGGAIGGTTPYTYLWSNGETSIKDTALTQGIYTLTVTDAHLCTDTVSINITQPTLLKDSVITFKNDSCFGKSNGSATAIFVGGTLPYTYLWSNGNTTAIDTLLPQGTYSLLTTDAHGCTATTSVTINQPPVLTVTSTPKLICISNTATLTALAVGGNTLQPYTYSIAGSATNTATVNPTTTTMYTLQVTDMKKCVANNMVTVFVRNPLSFLAVSPGTEKCPGFSSNLNATGSGGDSTFTYSWNPGNLVSQNITVTPAATTVYTLTLSDACGTPTVATTVTVAIDTLPQINFTADQLSGCYPLCVQFSNATTIASADGITYSWNLGANQLSTNANPYQCYTKAGIYTVSVTATTSKGCISKTSIPNMITVYNHPKAHFYTSPNDPNIVNPTIQFADASSGGGSAISGLFWQSFGDGSDSTSMLSNPTHTYKDTGSFCTTLIATNTWGCKDTVTECVIIQPYFTIYIPNSFTPNGDGRNEVFNAEGDYITTYDMKIFDRWGNLIFHSTDLANGWTGIKNGMQLQEDVYVYIINVTDPVRNPYSYKGTVTLLR